MKLKEPGRGSRLAIASVIYRLPGSLRWSLFTVIFLILAMWVASISTHHGMQLSRIATNYLRGLSAHPKHIQIGIKFENLQKLAYKRDQALDEGILISSKEDFVPAQIQYGDQVLKARIRLKGDWVYDNLEGDKWSFRVVLKGGGALFGMKQFSLHRPGARNYIYE